MKNTLVRIKKDVPLTIFDEPSVSERVNQLFDGQQETIRQRVDEILAFLKVEPAEQLSHDNISFLFKAYFYKSIITDAVEMAFTEKGKYDVKDNIMSLLSETKLKDAIMGRPMIDAFKKAIQSIPPTSALSACLHGSKMFLLEQKFLNINPFRTSKVKVESEQNNFCGDCDCSCTCDGSCNGDTQKCTSKEAINKKCNHHCGCYLGPLSENFRK